MIVFLSVLLFLFSVVRCNPLGFNQPSITCETYMDYVLRGGNCAISFLSNSFCTDGLVCYDRTCLPASLRCNGVKDCKDGEDERDELCPYYECAENKFRCKYGGCIDINSKCNGTIECLDNSDEDPELCNPSPDKKEGCVAPAYPDNGKYVPVSPGEVVEDGTVLIYTCNKSYKFVTQKERDYVICFAGEWEKSFPECKKACPPLTDTLVTKCEYGDKSLNCSLPVPHGTRVTTSCEKNFESKHTRSGHSVSVCNNGDWDKDVIECVPECGKPIADGQSLTIRGFKAKKGAFPWHVGVYMKSDKIFDFICGGSLIKMNMVLSAAHCFAADDGGTVFDEGLYKIGAGKYYRELNDDRDASFEQIRKVKQIKVNVEYKGILNNYRDDIAVVILEEPFEVSNVIQPVCIDWDNKLEDEQLKLDSIGDVVGWGFTTEQDTPAEELQQIRVPYIESESCHKILPRSFYAYISADKFCGGHSNGTSVCKGDSGGGVVFLDDTSGRYYLRGIVSAGPKKGLGCDSFKYTLFTKLSLFLKTIKKVVAESHI